MVVCLNTEEVIFSFPVYAVVVLLVRGELMEVSPKKEEWLWTSSAIKVKDNREDQLPWSMGVGLYLS